MSSRKYSHTNSYNFEFRHDIWSLGRSCVGGKSRGMLLAGTGPFRKCLASMVIRSILRTEKLESRISSILWRIQISARCKSNQRTSYQVECHNSGKRVMKKTPKTAYLNYISV